MAEKIYIVEGRQFRTDSDHKKALHDQKIIEELREKIKNKDIKVLHNIRNAIESGKYQFFTVLGDDFIDELDEEIRKLERAGSNKAKESKNARDYEKKSKGESVGRNSSDAGERLSSRYYSRKEDDAERDRNIEAQARAILKRKEKSRKLILIACATIAACSIGFVAVNSIIDYKKSMTNQALNNLRQQAALNASTSQQGVASNMANGNTNSSLDSEITIHYTGEQETPEIIPAFSDMLAVNSNLIGWLTIEGTNIDFPVAQTVDNEYYLSHDLNQNYDRNGTIFLDVNCDVIKPSTNLILYGHNMQSGNMFGQLDKYDSQEYYEGHKYITFDSLYEYGTYQVMYVFRSHVFDETEIAFKYYQFYEAYSEVEFDSYMQEMANMSLYDTGVSASFGDRLLTLSTCDYQEKNGRFVVVAKKIK